MPFLLCLFLEDCKPLSVVFKVNTLFCTTLILDISVKLSIFIELISKGSQLTLLRISYISVVFMGIQLFLSEAKSVFYILTILGDC